MTKPKDPKDKIKTGRPSDYQDQKTIKIAVALYEIGKTDAEVAEVLEVTETTINNWKHAHPEFFKSIKEAKDIANEEVERSLFERAKGYSHKSEKIFLSRHGDIVRADTTEHYPPDPTSMIFWLKNRDKDRWRDKQDVDLNVSMRPVIMHGKKPT